MCITRCAQPKQKRLQYFVAENRNDLEISEGNCDDNWVLDQKQNHNEHGTL